MAFLAATRLLLADSQDAVTAVLTAPESNSTVSALNTSKLDAANATPLGGLVSLASAPGAALCWRLTDGQRVLELRKLILAADHQNSSVVSATNTAQSPQSYHSNDADRSADLDNLLDAAISGTARLTVTGMSDEVGDAALDSRPFEIALPAPCIPSPHFFEVLRDGSLHILLVTNNGLFYRLVMSLTTLWRGVMRVECFTMKSLLKKVPLSISCIDICNAIVTTTTGELILLQRVLPSYILPRTSTDPVHRFSKRQFDRFSRDRVDYLEHELHDSSFLKRLGRLFKVFKTKGTDDSMSDYSVSDAQCVLATSAVTDGGSSLFLFGLTLTRSGHLRVWDLQSKSLKGTITIPVEHLRISRHNRSFTSESASMFSEFSTSGADGARPLLDKQFGDFISVLDIQYSIHGKEATDISLEEKKFANLYIYIAMYLPEPSRKVKTIVFYELAFTYGGSGDMVYKMIGEVQLPEVYEYDVLMRSLVDFQFIPKSSSDDASKVLATESDDDNQSDNAEMDAESIAVDGRGQTILRDNIRTFTLWLLFKELDPQSTSGFSAMRSDVELNLGSQSVDITDIPIIDAQWMPVLLNDSISIYSEFKVGADSNVPTSLKDIFIPGRYSEQVIKQSLADYCGQQKLNDVIASSDVDSSATEWEALQDYTVLAIRENLAAVCLGMSRQYQMEKFTEELDKFVALCEEKRKLEEFPCSLTVDPSRQLCGIVTAEQLVILREGDFAETCNSLVKESYEDTEQTYRMVLDSYDNVLAAEDLEYLKVFVRTLKSLESLDVSFSIENNEELTRAISEQGSMDDSKAHAILTSVMQEVFGPGTKKGQKDVLKDHSSQMTKFLQKLAAFLCTHAIDIVEAPAPVAESFGSHVHFSSTSGTNDSMTGVQQGKLANRSSFAVVSRAIADVSKERYIFLKSLVKMTQVLYSATARKTAIIEDLDKVVLSYSVLTVLSHIRVSSVVDSEAAALALQKQDSNMSFISDVSDSNGELNLPSQDYLRKNISCELSLIEYMMHEMVGHTSSFKLSQQMLSSSITDASLYYLAKFNLLPSGSYDSTLKNILIVSKFLFLTRQYDALYQLVQLLPADAAFSYLKGRYFLAYGQHNLAKRHFIVASSAVDKKDSNLRLLLPESILSKNDKSSFAGYYFHVAELFEQYSDPESVIQFAKMSEDAFLKTYGSSAFKDAHVGDPLAVTLKSLISGIFFRNALRADDYVSACKSLILISDARERSEKLKQFVGVVCKSGRIADISAKYPQLQSEIEAELLRRVGTMSSDDILLLANFPLSTTKAGSTAEFTKEEGLENAKFSRSVVGSSGDRRINYYEVLYTYYSLANRVADAAKAMYTYGTRLNALTSTPALASQKYLGPVLAQQASSYLIAYEVLKTLNPENAWFITYEDPTHGMLEFSGSQEPFWKKRAVVRDNSKVLQQGGIRMNADDIHKLYLLVEAKIELIRSTANATHGLPSPQTAFTLFLQLGQYERAMEFGLRFNINLTKLFERMSHSCIFTLDDTGMLRNIPLGWTGDRQTKMWRLVESFTERVRDDQQRIMYVKHIAEYVVRTDGRGQVPMWIVRVLGARHSQDLLAVYLKMGRLREAVDVSVRLLDRASKSLDNASVRATTWIPVGLLDRLEAALAEHREFVSQAPRLRAALSNYLARVKSLSEHQRHRAAMTRRKA